MSEQWPHPRTSGKTIRSRLNGRQRFRLHPPWPEQAWKDIADADLDIRVGNVQKFDTVDDMLAALKEPWLPPFTG